MQTIYAEASLLLLLNIYLLFISRGTNHQCVGGGKMQVLLRENKYALGYSYLTNLTTSS